MYFFLCILLSFSLAAFGLDLFHMIYHLVDEPSLWRFEGVPAKLLLKIFWLSIPVLLLLFRRRWKTILFMLFFAGAAAPHLFASSDACQHARELLKKSGIARDANENWMGKVKVDPPSGSFPPDMDKITWWGEFEPFEFWQSPEFKAVWIDPDGREAGRGSFRGAKCSLAKTEIKGPDQPRGEFKGGIWSVLVTCEDYLVSKENFAVLPSGAQPKSGGDSGKKNDDSQMIWVKDKI